LTTVPDMIRIRSASLTATVIFVSSLIAGAGAGLGIGALKYSDGGRFSSTEWALMMQQPLTGAAKTFNWLLFCIFAAAGIVAAATTWAAITVCNTIADAHGQQMKALSALKAPAALPPPAGPDTLRTSGSFFGVR
jgi:hypothetical protein